MVTLSKHLVCEFGQKGLEAWILELATEIETFSKKTLVWVYGTQNNVNF